MEKRRLRKMRKNEATLEARILYEEFANDDGGLPDETSWPRSREHEGNDSDEEFWRGLGGSESPFLRIVDRVSEPWECTQRMARPSRLQRLSRVHGDQA